MYSVYSVVDGDEICIYDDWSDSPEIRLIDPQLTLERNGAGSFEFTLPPTNLAYGTYQLKTYTIIGYRPIDNQSENSENNQNEGESEEYPEAPVEPIVEEHIREVDLVERMSSHIIIYRDEEYVSNDPSSPNSVVRGLRKKVKFWEGRVIDETKDWFNCRKVTCEGALAYLNDTIQNPQIFVNTVAGTVINLTPQDMLQRILDYHNSKVDSSRIIKLGYCDIGAGDAGSTATTEPFQIDYVSSIQAFQSLMERYGGVAYIYYTSTTTAGITKWETKLAWLKTDSTWRPADRTLEIQSIDFGRNLLDFNCKWDLSKLCTVAIPIGKQLDKDPKDDIGESITAYNTGGYTAGQYLVVGDGECGDKGIVYVNSDNGTGYNIKAYKTAVYNLERSSGADIPEDDLTVYITCRATAGVAAYCTCKANNFACGTPWGKNQIGYAIAKPATGATFQDFIDYKVTLPHGTRSIALCSYGDDITMGVKRQKKWTTTTINETEMEESVIPLSGHLSVDHKTGSYKLVYETRTDSETGETIVTDHVIASFDDNYNYRIFDVSDIPAGDKLYIFARAEVGTVVFAGTKATSLSSRDNQLYRMDATSSTDRFKELNAYEYSKLDGINYIHVVSYEGQGSGYGTDWPKVTYNRKVTEQTTGEYHSDVKYVTVEEADSSTTWHEKGSPYVVNQTLLEKYGRIERTLSFEECEDPNVLLQKAMTYLQDAAYDEMSIDISAIDMRALGYRNVDYLNIEDKVHATSVIHGLDKIFPVTKLSIPLNKPENMKVTLNKTSHQSMTESTVKANQNLLENIKYASSTTLTKAKDAAAAMIGAGGNGYVSLIRDDSGNYIKEIVISNQSDPHNSSNVWIFNSGGLGHFHDDNGHAYPLPSGVTTDVALTMDGSIVADRIRSGTIHGIGIHGTNGLYMPEITGEPSAVFWNPGDYYCMRLINGKIQFIKVLHDATYAGVTMDDNGNIHIDAADTHTDPDTGETVIDPFAYIQATSSTGTDNILSLTGPIIAINAGEVWVSSSSAGTDGRVALNGTFYLPKTNDPQSASDYQEVTFRNGFALSYS